MMARLLAWFRQWRMARRMRRDAAALSSRLDRLESRLEKRRTDLGLYERRLAAISEELSEDLALVTSEIAAIRSELRESARRRELYEAELETMRARLKVAEDITIPALVEANRLTLERYRADIDVQALRSAGLKP